MPLLRVARDLAESTAGHPQLAVDLVRAAMATRRSHPSEPDHAHEGLHVRDLFIAWEMSRMIAGIGSTRMSQYAGALCHDKRASSDHGSQSNHQDAFAGPLRPDSRASSSASILPPAEDDNTRYDESPVLSPSYSPLPSPAPATSTHIATSGGGDTCQSQESLEAELALSLRSPGMPTSPTTENYALEALIDANEELHSLREEFEEYKARKRGEVVKWNETMAKYRAHEAEWDAKIN